MNSKRIAKNTFLLYIRMFFIMIVSFYTTRVVFNNLGVVDYGIYNVVGGVIALFSFLKVSMTSSTQRYITFELGKGDVERLKSVFSTSVQIHFCISVIFLLLSETIGLWFLYNKLVVPVERMDAAFWVYQCSVVVAINNIISVPYNADIVAHEKMSAFAYISVIEVLLKLIIAFLIDISSYDKLKFFSILHLFSSVIIRYIYRRYCSMHFEESVYRHEINISLLKTMSSFAGWSLFGNIAYLLYSQGLNIMLNIFFGPAVNAARGVAVQVQGVVQRFVSDFQTALNPQITKSYASDRISDMHTLMFRSARFSFFLLFFLCLPILLETDMILFFWLKKVPDNSAIFLRIILCISLIYCIANPMIFANQATGDVKKYQIVCGMILLAILPISYFFLSMGYPAYIVFVVHFLLEIICQGARMYMLRNQIKISIKDCFQHIYFPIISVVITSLFLPLFFHLLLSTGIFRFFCVSFFGGVSVLFSSYLLGFEKNEKMYFRKLIKDRL